MRRAWVFVVRRLAWMVVTAWVVLTLAFVLFVVVPDPNISLVRFFAGPSAEAQREAVEAYEQARNYDTPVLRRYVTWLVNYATFQWGSTLDGTPVTAALGRAIVVTLTYLLPALLVSTVAALGVGLYVATHRGGIVDRLLTSLAYAGYGVPIFFAGEMLFGLLAGTYDMVWLVFDEQHGLYSAENVDQFLLPAVVMAVHLTVVQLVLIRSELLEKLNAAYTKTLVASGAGVRDLARHALRNAAIPLVAAFFAQSLTLLYLGVIVLEVVFDLPGFGALTFRAINDRDVALILGTTFVPLLVALFGNFLQDLIYPAIDPRIDYGDR